MTMAVVSTDLGPLFGNARDFWLGCGLRYRSGADLAIYRSNVSHPQLNGVLRLRHGGVDDALHEAGRQLDGVPWLWWTGADSRPGLAEDLLARDAVNVGSVPVMAIQLDQVLDETGPAELTIDDIRDPDDLPEWVRAYRSSFGLTEDQVDDLLTVEKARPGRGIVRFAGRIDGRIVGTSLLYVRHGVAGVYQVATVEGFRRRGIGTRLTAAALRAGRARGLRVGTLVAGSMGASMHRRMGFTQVAAYQLLRPPQ
ncbi:MAG TPA: GNAT family N-acetyltransferase [Pseudonocardiaceae bacterium]|nr:GNAT family N-acetyltransferase [Pseudonocardiaceae bacterium]